MIISYRRGNVSCNVTAVRKQVKSFVIYISPLHILREALVIK